MALVIRSHVGIPNEYAIHIEAKSIMDTVVYNYIRGVAINVLFGGCWILGVALNLVLFNPISYSLGLLTVKKSLRKG